MSTAPFESEGGLAFNKSLFNAQLTQLSQPTLKSFHKITQSYAIFNFCFLFLALIEFLLILFLGVSIFKSTFFAVTLAVVFLTSFSYFVLRLYFLTRKPEQIIDLRDQYVEAAKECLNYQEGFPEHHMALSSAVCKLVSILHDCEYAYYSLPEVFRFLHPTMRKFSCWWHWHDVSRLKELLFQTSINEHIKLVKCEPTNLEVHATLANAYVMLSSLYTDPRKSEGYDEEVWYHPDSFSESMKVRFRLTAERAIEEFKILREYAPNDPWVHSQLAYSYHDLKMPEEEIKEYELILQLRPGDSETLFKLGTLYFQQGLNAKGLHVYEQLRHSHYKKAENLIKFYGAYSDR